MVTTKKSEEQQQQFANSVGYRGTIVWDRFAASEKEVLAAKLEILFPTFVILEEDQENSLSAKEKKNIEKENDKIIEKRKKLLEQIWAQRIYCGGNLKMSIIYILIAPIIDKDSPVNAAKDSTIYSVHPVFRIWKCEVQGESNNCCKIFIDECGRVYENWTDFIQNNMYPEGIFIAPRNGVYDMDDQNKVILECHLTPSSTTLKKALQITDTSASIVGILGSAVPAGIALFTPVALPVVIGAVAVGGVTSIYAMGRSIANLVDRGQHEQSINITDRQARLDWFSLFGGVFSLGASGATIGVASHIARGRVVPLIAERAVKGASAAAIAVNGVGVGNGIAEVIIKINQNEKFSSLEILQFSTSLLLFTHSIYNYQLASRIIEKSKASAVEIETVLNEEQSQYFTEMVNETMRMKGSQDSQCIGGSAQSNSIDLVRCLRKIPDKTSGLILSQLTPLNGFRIAGMAKQIAENYFISSEGDLKNCLNVLIQNLCPDGIDFILSMAESFLHDILEEIESAIRPLIPFEHLVWDIFEISSHIRGIKRQITKDFLIMNMDLIQNEFKKRFSEYLDRNSAQMIKCTKCVGHYQKCKLTE